MENMNDNFNLATELLHVLKASARRWFIAFCVMVGLEVATILGFFWYISLPVEESTITQETQGDANTVIGIGDDYGDKANSDN